MECLIELEHREAMAISYSNNGDYLMSAGKDRNIKLWNSSSGRLIKNYSGGNNYEINSIRISNDNSFFLSSGADSNIFLWDVSKGTVVTKMQGHKKKVSTLCWNYSDQLFISGSDDNLVKVWDTREKTSVDTLNASKDSIVKVESNSDQIVSGSVDGYLQTYDIRCGVVYLDYLNDLISCMDVKKDGEMVLTTHTDGAIRVTDRAAGQVIKAFAHIGNSENYLVPCAFTQDLKIVVGGNNGEIDVYDIDDGFVKQFQGRDSQIVSLITHPRCKDVIATTDQNSIKIMRI